MARPEKVRLGEILVGQKLVSEEQLKFALEEQKRSGRKLGRFFVEQGYATEEQISEAIARQLNIPFINLKFYNFKAEIVRLLPETQARRFRHGAQRSGRVGGHGRPNGFIRLRRNRAHCEMRRQLSGGE